MFKLLRNNAPWGRVYKILYGWFLKLHQVIEVCIIYAFFNNLAKMRNKRGTVKKKNRIFQQPRKKNCEKPKNQKQEKMFVYEFLFKEKILNIFEKS